MLKISSGFLEEIKGSSRKGQTFARRFGSRNKRKEI